MYRFNIKVDPDIVADLCLNENTVIEAFYAGSKGFCR